MALSNAERQRRYIERLKAKAAVSNGTVSNEKPLSATREQRYQKRIDDLEKHMADAEEIINALSGRKGIFTRSDYRTLLMCLHPDRSASDQTLSAMLNKVQELERVLTAQKRH
jgi:hypothetical protein